MKKGGGKGREDLIGKGLASDGGEVTRGKGVDRSAKIWQISMDASRRVFRAGRLRVDAQISTDPPHAYILQPQLFDVFSLPSGRSISVASGSQMRRVR